jgi:fibronectin-binding autotransporter adhesin
MRINVISLERTPERLAEFRKLNGHLKHVAVFKAVDGATLSQDELAARGVIVPPDERRRGPGPADRFGRCRRRFAHRRHRDAERRDQRLRPGARFISLVGTPFNSSGSAQVLSGNVLQVVEGSATDDLQLDPSVNYSALFSAGDSLVLLPHGGGTLVTIGQVVTVSSGSGISGTTISSGIIEEIFGSAVSTTVAAGGIAVVFSGGTASATALNGAYEFLYGTDTKATVVSGATLRVESGATASTDTIGNGGVEIVFSGAAASGATVAEGGALNLRGGTAYNTFVSGLTLSIGGALNVRSGGAASGATISEFGFENVWSGGTAISTTVMGSGNFDPNGGTLSIRGGTASGSVISSGGFEAVGGGISNSGFDGFVGFNGLLSGSKDFGATILAGGSMSVNSGGTVTSATVIGNSAFDPHGGSLAIRGGTASGIIISSGGFEVVSPKGQFAGSKDFGATILAGGRMNVSAGGTVSGVTLVGGQLQLFSGGTASATVINSGSEFVYSGGLTNGTVVSSGGFEQVGFYTSGFQNLGGTTIGTTVSSGGLERVWSAGVASATTATGKGAIIDPVACSKSAPASC